MMPWSLTGFAVGISVWPWAAAMAVSSAGSVEPAGGDAGASGLPQGDSGLAPLSALVTLLGTNTSAAQYGQRQTPPAKALSIDIFFLQSLQRILVAMG